MERDIGGLSSPPHPDGGILGSRAPKLSALFAQEHQRLQVGNSSFQYHPPKLPGSHATAPKVNLGSGFPINSSGENDIATPALTPQVLHSVAVSQLVITNSSGQSHIGSAGMAIVDTNLLHAKSFHLVVYDASKRTLMSTAITKDLFCTPKYDGWVDFNNTNQTWSVLFTSTEDWVDLAKALVLAHSVMARSSNSFFGVIYQDVSPQENVPQAGVRDGDLVQVTYRAWTERPGVPGTLGPCFQEITGKGKKLELGSGKAVQGLEQGVKGMTRNSRRLMIFPSHLGYSSSPERADRVSTDAILFFDVTVCRTRKQKGPVGNDQWQGRELPSEYFAINGDVGSERDENTPTSTITIEKVKADGLGNSFMDFTEETGPDSKDVVDDKREMLIDRMARLSRIGGAGSLPLPTSGVTNQKRSMSASSDLLIDATQVVESEVQDKVTQLPEIHNSSPKSTRNSNESKIHCKANFGMGDYFDVNKGEQDAGSEGDTHVSNMMIVDCIDRSPAVIHDRDHLESKTGDTMARADDMVAMGSSLTAPIVSEGPNIASTIPVSTEDANKAGPGIAKDKEPVGPGAEPSTASTSEAPQSPYVMWPTVSPFPVPQVSQSGTTLIPPFSACTLFPTNLSGMNSTLPSVGPMMCGPSPLSGQSTSPYLGFPHGVMPWLPCFPQYPPSYGVGTESRYDNQQIALLQKIQETQECFAISLKDLTAKVEGLSEFSQHQPSIHGRAQSRDPWGSAQDPGNRGLIFDGQSSADEGDFQVDRVVESVALMLAENRELKRRLLLLKDKPLEQSTRSKVKEISPSRELTEDQETANKAVSRLMVEEDEESGKEELPTGNTKKSNDKLVTQMMLDTVEQKQESTDHDKAIHIHEGLLVNETESRRLISEEVKHIMSDVYREVAEELRQSTDAEQNLLSIYGKLMGTADAVVQILHDQSFVKRHFKSGAHLLHSYVDDHRTPRSADKYSEVQDSISNTSNDTTLDVEVARRADEEVLHAPKNFKLDIVSSSMPQEPLNSNELERSEDLAGLAEESRIISKEADVDYYETALDTRKSNSRVWG